MVLKLWAKKNNKRRTSARPGQRAALYVRSSACCEEELRISAAVAIKGSSGTNNEVDKNGNVWTNKGMH